MLKDAAGIPGDVNNDGAIDVSDVTLLISIVLSNNTDGYDFAVLDLDHDGYIDVSDVSALIKIVLNSSEE